MLNVKYLNKFQINHNKNHKLKDQILLKKQKSYWPKWSLNSFEGDDLVPVFLIMTEKILNSLNIDNFSPFRPKLLSF